MKLSYKVLLIALAGMLVSLAAMLFEPPVEQFIKALGNLILVGFWLMLFLEYRSKKDKKIKIAKLRSRIQSFSEDIRYYESKEKLIQLFIAGSGVVFGYLMTLEKNTTDLYIEVLKDLGTGIEVQYLLVGIYSLSIFFLSFSILWFISNACLLKEINLFEKNKKNKKRIACRRSFGRINIYENTYWLCNFFMIIGSSSVIFIPLTLKILSMSH